MAACDVRLELDSFVLAKGNHMTWNRRVKMDRWMRGPRLLIVAPALVGAILTGCGDDATSNPVIPDAGTPDTGNVVPDAGKPETAPELKPAGVPTFSTPGGKYTAAQSVTISSSTPNADIWYTLDLSLIHISEPTRPY